ncbi:MAG: cobalamin-dependent protein [Clostridiaceae bacterium]
MNNIFALRMKSLRKEYGYTQSEVASKLNIGQTTIANYENGSRIPDISKLSMLADLYVVSIDYLLGRSEERVLSEVHHVAPKEQIDTFYKDYMQSLLNLDKDRAKEIILSLLENKVALADIYFEFIKKSLIEIGTQWESGMISVWKEHGITEISKEILELLKKSSSPKKEHSKPILAFTPGAELHHIGLKMLCDMLEMKGFDVVFLGNSIPSENIIQAIEEKDPQSILISVTMPYHIDSAIILTQLIKATFGNKSPKILLGGSAFEHMENIELLTGADKYCTDIDEILETLK